MELVQSKMEKIEANLMLKMILKYAVILFLLSLATRGSAETVNILVLGVITSDNVKQGIALVKNKSSGKVTAVKVGAELDKNTILAEVKRRHVKIMISGKPFELEVGAEVATLLSETPRSNSIDLARSREGFEKTGDKVKITSAFKEQLIGQDLGKILMQAATEPFVKDGRVIGFRLWEIDKDSIYEQAGLINGDIITHINDKALNDAGLAIRILNQLKTADKINVNYLRDGNEHNLSIEVQ